MDPKEENPWEMLDLLEMLKQALDMPWQLSLVVAFTCFILSAFFILSHKWDASLTPMLSLDSTGLAEFWKDNI